LGAVVVEVVVPVGAGVVDSFDPEVVGVVYSVDSEVVDSGFVVVALPVGVDELVLLVGVGAEVQPARVSMKINVVNIIFFIIVNVSDLFNSNCTGHKRMKSAMISKGTRLSEGVSIDRLVG
jgi:hypothetical protein